jgi:hypothetical protein
MKLFIIFKSEPLIDDQTNHNERTTQFRRKKLQKVPIHKIERDQKTNRMISVKL